MSSSKTQISLEYYSLPVCKPETVFQLKQNIGNVLSGEEFSNTLYSFKMLENHVLPQVVCKVKFTQEEADLLKMRIDQFYNVQWYDSIPNLIIG